MNSNIAELEALQLVYLCEWYLQQGQQLRLRILLGSGSITQCPAFWTQLLAPAPPIAARVRSVAQGIVGTLLLAMRDLLPAQSAQGSFDNASQLEAVDSHHHHLQGVMQLESQSLPPPPENTSAPFNGLHLFALLHACRAPKPQSAADEAVEVILAAMEADRRATVNLAALAMTLVAAVNDHAASANKQSAAVAAVEASFDADVSQRAKAASSAAEQLVQEIEALRREEQPGRPQPSAEPLRPEPVAAAGSPNLPRGSRALLHEANTFDEVDAPTMANYGAADGALAPRSRVAFTAAEDDAILAGIQRFHGANKFQEIYHYYASHTHPTTGAVGVWQPSRTPAQIADHYRQSLRRRRLLGD